MSEDDPSLRMRRVRNESYIGKLSKGPSPPFRGPAPLSTSGFACRWVPDDVSFARFLSPNAYQAARSHLSEPQPRQHEPNGCLSPALRPAAELFRYAGGQSRRNGTSAGLRNINARTRGPLLDWDFERLAFQEATRLFKPDAPVGGVVTNEVLAAVDRLPTLAGRVGASKFVPTGRPIDGVDASALMLRKSD